jgi:hypothetical protein
MTFSFGYHCVNAILDTQGEITYTSARKKGLLITLLIT